MKYIDKYKWCILLGVLLLLILVGSIYIRVFHSTRTVKENINENILLEHKQMIEMFNAHELIPALGYPYTGDNVDSAPGYIESIMAIIFNNYTYESADKIEEDEPAFSFYIYQDDEENKQLMEYATVYVFEGEIQVQYLSGAVCYRDSAAIELLLALNIEFFTEENDAFIEESPALLDDIIFFIGASEKSILSAQEADTYYKQRKDENWKCVNKKDAETALCALGEAKQGVVLVGENSGTEVHFFDKYMLVITEDKVAHFLTNLEGYEN